MLQPVAELVTRHGQLRIFRHASEFTGVSMQFALFVPHGLDVRNAPVVIVLGDAGATEQTLCGLGAVQEAAVQSGVVLLAPDSLPRDFALSSQPSFYVNATREPWSTRIQMCSYISYELRSLAATELQCRTQQVGITGVGMGGHGALVLALRKPEVFKSASAFNPKLNPSTCPESRSFFQSYFGDQRAMWRCFDACALMRDSYRPIPSGILIDLDLEAVAEPAAKLSKSTFITACRQAAQPLELRIRALSDPARGIVASHITEHLTFHARALRGISIDVVPQTLGLPPKTHFLLT